MSIYKPFKPTFLYIKIHNKTGLKYFGKTVKKDPYSYKGSGKYWINHLNVHGFDFSTEIIGYYTDEKKCKEDALKFSEENNIVNSSEWANLKEETLDGGGTPGQVWKQETIQKRSESNKGMVRCKDIHGNKYFISKQEFSEREDLVGLSKGIKLSPEACKKFSELRKGSIQSEETRLKKSLSLKGKNKGKQRSEETKQKLRLSHLGKQQSKETCIKRSNTMKGKNTGSQKIVTCPHCGKSGGISGMKHYHFDRCKTISTLPSPAPSAKYQEE